MAEPQSLDELFPPKEQSLDELFPPQVERERYRRQTLGTSPIQDLIFGDTSVNPIARILDHFGQGARQGWGAEPNGLSDESAEALKKIGIFNDYDKGQRSIIKAANESLFRSAATYLADPIMRGLPAAFRGTQEAIAQTGEELGQPKLGREAAGALEALPTGLRAPTGIPHAPIKYLQAEARAGVPVERAMAAEQARQAENVGAAETNILMAEIERARDLKTIGAGEAGWKGIADAPAPTIAEQAATAKPEVLESAEPVRPRPEPMPADAAPVDVAERAAGAVEEPAGAPITAEHPIAPKPKIVMPGEGAKPERANQSLLDFLAREGGLKPTADLKQIFGDQNPTIPGAGKLFRKDGMSMDQALTKAKESSFILDPNDIQHAPGVENKGANTVRWHDLHDQITRGKFRTVPGGKPVITLFKDANASTFIHETGHHWLEELMKDSQHDKAPAGLRADADSVLKWLGVDSYHDIKVRHHEQFARGFERYMMEGKAPTQGLARVFEKFKNWLTKIYQTVDRLKSPINDEIRACSTG
jgi:hypothetical protein